MTRLCIVLLFAACAFAQLGPSRIGCFVDERGRLRFVQGAPGAFVVSEPARDGVLSASCAERTIVKLEDALEVDELRFAAPQGPAEFLPGGLVHFTGTDEWMRLSGNALETVPAPEPRPRDPQPPLAAGAFVVFGSNRVEFPCVVAGVEQLGADWFRVILDDGTHYALSIPRGRAWRLPDVPPERAATRGGPSGPAPAIRRPGVSR